MYIPQSEIYEKFPVENGLKVKLSQLEIRNDQLTKNSDKI